jgi:hypothetical protein
MLSSKKCLKNICKVRTKEQEGRTTPTLSFFMSKPAYKIRIWIKPSGKVVERRHSYLLAKNKKPLAASISAWLFCLCAHYEFMKGAPSLLLLCSLSFPVAKGTTALGSMVIYILSPHSTSRVRARRTINIHYTHVSELQTSSKSYLGKPEVSNVPHR